MKQQRIQDLVPNENMVEQDINSQAQSLRGPRRQINIIAAVDADGGFARDSRIPWNFSEDFKWFRQATSDSICVMGRNTYHDINNRLGEKAAVSVLPGRKCYVLSSSMAPVPNATVVRDYTELFNLINQEPINIPVFFIGGGQIFSDSIKFADVVALTVIYNSHDCNQYFPTDYLLDHFTASSIRSGEHPHLRYVLFTRNSACQKVHMQQ